MDLQQLRHLLIAEPRDEAEIEHRFQVLQIEVVDAILQGNRENLDRVTGELRRSFSFAYCNGANPDLLETSLEFNTGRLAALTEVASEAASRCMPAWFLDLLKSNLEFLRPLVNGPVTFTEPCDEMNVLMDAGIIVVRKDKGEIWVRLTGLGEHTLKGLLACAPKSKQT
jgi:hypothetical protein